VRGSLASLALLALALTGCPQSTEKSAPPSPGASVAPSNSQARLSPQIVTAAPALAELVCALGGEAHLSGVSSYCTYPPSLTKLPQIGGAIDPNLEVIDGLAPDLVLLQGRHAGLEELAQRRPWRIERFRIERIEDVLLSLDRLGQLLRRVPAAARERARLEAALEAARAGRPERAPKTLLVFGRRPGALTQLSCSGEGTFLSECLEAVGGTNCLSGLGGYPLISTEVLLERAPELIVELSPEPLTAETRAALRADWAAFGSLPAVATGRVAIVSGAELLLPGPRLDQTLAKLRRVLAGETDVE
jgi:cobalamin transport system substrate-binding protein